MEKPRRGTTVELCNVCRASSRTVYSSKCQKLLLPLVNFKTEARTESHAASADARGGTSVGRGDNVLEVHNRVTEATVRFSSYEFLCSVILIYFSVPTNARPSNAVHIIRGK